MKKLRWPWHLVSPQRSPSIYLCSGDVTMKAPNLCGFLEGASQKFSKVGSGEVKLPEILAVCSQSAHVQAELAERSRTTRIWRPMGHGVCSVLILEDGSSVYESRFILEWLELKYPQTPMLPSDIDGIIAARKVEVVVDGASIPARGPTTRWGS